MERSEERERAGHFARRDFCGVAALAGVGIAALSQAAAQEASAAETSETNSHVVGESRSLSGDPTTAEILVDTLVGWGVSHVFGIVGDGITPIIEALRKRKSEIQFVGVRHEEAAAFMAGGFGQATRKARG